MSLTLVHASKAYPSAEWGPDQFCVMHDGKPAGSIAKQSMAGSAERWWWEITTRESPGLFKGPAASKEGAMQAFHEAWDKMPSRAGSPPQSP